MPRQGRIQFLKNVVFETQMIDTGFMQGKNAYATIYM